MALLLTDASPTEPNVLDGYTSRSVVPAVLVFWLAWAGARLWWGYATPWLALTAQLWVAYALPWLALWALRARQRGNNVGWSTIALVCVGASLLGAIASLPLAIDFLPTRLLSPEWWLRRGALPWGFGLLLHFPGLLIRRREWRRHQGRLAGAEQATAMAELARQITLAELKTLQAQVEPHFLYNTLASLQYLIRRNPALADEMLTRLHDYLRLALPTMRAPMSTLSRELELARAYLGIMKLRLGNRFEFNITLPPELTAVPIAPMMVATLVENAVKHGIEPKVGDGHIAITALRVGPHLRIEVRDNGQGLAQGAPATAGQGVGLANLRDRLTSIYGDAARLHIATGANGQGVVASIQVPCT
jgi:signal transduction histidine kinase